MVTYCLCAMILTVPFIKWYDYFFHFVRYIKAPWPNYQLLWLSDIKVTCCVWQWLAGDAKQEKNTRLSKVSISLNLAGKIHAKSDCAVQLWCLPMETEIGKVNDGPYYCPVGLIVGLWFKFHLIRAPRSADSIPICLCKIFCSPCYAIYFFARKFVRFVRFF